MATLPVRAHGIRNLVLEKSASFPNLRALAWHKTKLYAGSGYRLLAAEPGCGSIAWREIGRFRPRWWQNVAARNELASRLVRAGFHALAVHPKGNLVAAVPSAIATLRLGEEEFRTSHRITRGTRPLHIAATPCGKLFWGEYFDNPERNEVHVYASEDAGLTWNVAYTFPPGSIRHIHNICYDRWQNCLWVFTGDYGRECKILRASLDCARIDEVLGGSQQVRAVAALVTDAGLFFASDTPLEQNYIYFLDRNGRVSEISRISSSSIYGCRNSNGLFFSAMAEPSDVNSARDVRLCASADGSRWDTVASWHKDRWPMKWFQYGNAFLPDGDNQTSFLAATTIAVTGEDMRTTLWRTSLSAGRDH